MMAEPLHTAATEHLPSFITAPGETDVLMVIMALVLVAAVVGFGILFFTLHTLPERIAHKSHKLQFEIVAVLGLLALFTHIHLFWVAGLLLALIDIPDVGGWLGSISGSLEKIADNRSSDQAAEVPEELIPSITRDEGTAKKLRKKTASSTRAEDAVSTKPEITPASKAS